MNKKSRTCKGAVSGEFLVEYQSEQEAEADAGYQSRVWGGDYVPYKCNKGCDKWHLSPKGRQTPSKRCVSCGKELYETEAAAKTRAAISKSERKVSLIVYKCPHNSGWHLTRKKQ